MEQLKIAAFASLKAVQHHRFPTLNTLRASLFMHGCMRQEEYASNDSRFVGTVLRVARNMGLHLDGSKLGIDDVASEVRRRVWWHILWLDVQDSVLNGSLICQPKKIQKKERLWTKSKHLDPLGNLLLVTAVIMLLLTLQWGGTEYAWTDVKVIGLLAGCALETLVFLAWQLYLKDDALIPLRLIMQRTVAASLLSGFFLSGTLFVHSYYLPYWFQAIKGETAVASGVDTIPYLVSNFICSMIAGGFVTKFGYFNPPTILGAALATVGCGLITTFSVDMPTSRWIGYLIITGAGIGTSIQQGIVAVQAVLPDDVVPIVTTLIIFVQSLSGAICVSMASNIMRNGLKSRLLTSQLPGVDVAQVLAAGATQLKDFVPVSQLKSVNMFYSDALANVLWAAVSMALTGFLWSLGMEWKSRKGKKIWQLVKVEFAGASGSSSSGQRVSKLNIYQLSEIILYEDQTPATYGLSIIREPSSNSAPELI